MKTRFGFAAALKSCTAVSLLAWGASGMAQTLPAPPTSPAPVINLEYDAQGNATKVIQAPGVTGFGFANSTSYDRLDRATKNLNAKNGRITLSYDGQDNLIKVTDPRNLVTQYPRNGLGDATQLISPDTGMASQSFDEAGNLKTRTDSRGVLATHTYDALNRLTSTVYSQGTNKQTFTWAYDQTGTGFANGVGRLTSSTHPNGSSKYAYDAQGRLTQAVQVINAASGANAAAITLTSTYGYNAAGQLISLTYPSGRQIRYTYTQGELTAMSLAASATATPVTLLSGIQWRGFEGVPSAWQWQTGTTTRAHNRVFDTSGRLVRYPLGDVTRDLTYDAADRITKYAHYNAIGQAQPALDQSFSYDALGQLTGVTTATASWSLQYDANGNRTNVSLNGAANAYSTAATSNRLVSTANPAQTFTYDAAGNLISRTGPGASTAVMDLSGRLTSATKGTLATTLHYDAFGQRIRKFSKTGTTLNPSSAVLFVYGSAGQLLGEYDQSGKPIREYVWLGTTPVVITMPDPAAATNPPLVFYIHTDHLDTPRVVLDRANKLRWRWWSEPFGNTAPEINPSNLGAFTQPLRMPGQVADAETGLFYNYFRDYDASTGRYTQSDPIGLAGGVNTYAYALSQPTKYTDPNGLFVVALPWVLPPVIEGAIYYGSAIAAGWVLTEAVSEPSAGDRAQQAQERKAYSRVCKSPIPPSGDQCRDAKANLDRLKQCLQMRESFSRKWFSDGDQGHMTEIDNTKRAISKLEEFLRNNCPNESCP